MGSLALFHFLRPLWLLALPVIAICWWLARRREAAATPVGDWVAEHLRAALTITRNGTGGLRPVDTAAAVAMLLALAAAGPAWDRQLSPWFSEAAPLVIALEVSDSMRSNDLLPTRLDRARFKILDLVKARTGARTALIAYAGSAHVVLPPSTDSTVIAPFLESLDPAVMPVAGADVSVALPLARDLLGEESARGTLLIVSDGFEPADGAALQAFAQQDGAPALVALVVGTQSGGVALMPDGSPVRGPSGARLDTSVDASVLRQVGSEAGMPVIRATAGDEDLRRVSRAIASALQKADDADAQWRDRGWLLLWPAAFLTLLWFRRGWSMQW
ncbi:MAG: VWA domain-containing protein [Pseudomonadota bacterium]